MNKENIQAALSRYAKGDDLYESSLSLLDSFGLKHDQGSSSPLELKRVLKDDTSFLNNHQDLLGKITDVRWVCVATEDTFSANQENSFTFDENDEKLKDEHYKEMAFFALKSNTQLTRKEIVLLTRKFNRRMRNRPVVLLILCENMLSLATCERSEYARSGMEGEKAGKVTILRNIDCSSVHRGHLDILASLDIAGCSSYDDLYEKWLKTFNNDVLTKRFYTELSDWYAWAVNIAKFPNDLRTATDDTKFNQESCIRLVTRIIFVWFLKQKDLIPKEFFDEEYIREHLIENFNPQEKCVEGYNAEDSKYYRLILQNLFFAMLNCPMVAEGQTKPNNRRFIKRSDDSDNEPTNLMRYESDFMNGGAAKFLKLANSKVPFLNGGLFDCLDNKEKGMYYDGFSERKESLDQLFLPDYLFFGTEEGTYMDLSEWYGDKRKKRVLVRGLINILSRYTFTIEENTPLVQEVSLDPELLGKVFENLLASFNPETNTSARKQTGSFYTPREIVQYMVDESLVAHLKRMCGDAMEQTYRDLISYSTEDVELSEEQRKSIMNSIYNCRILDPACGSGAFPMGILQQMVHILNRIDKDNKMWNDMLVDIAIEDTKKELKRAANNEKERQQIQLNKEARLADIEEAFNQDINDPDYARKLYLIEHCIYGVDIQPIATQISKLRFFISLIVDQKPTKDATKNFGIRPLPNLESKFVTANTLIPLNRSRDLFSSSSEIKFYEDQLHDLNHRIFLAKRNKDKKELRQLMIDTRNTMAQVMENEGFISKDGFSQLTQWNPFDQNASAPFFDPEWMFGVKDGFDVVIGNPPYIKEYTSRDAFVGIKGVSPYYMGKMDLWYVFACYGLDLTIKNGVLCFIAQNNWTTSAGAKLMRDKIVGDARILKMLDFNDYMVFKDSASIQTMVMLFANNSNTDNYTIDYRKLNAGSMRTDMIDLLNYVRTPQTYFSSPLFTRELFKNKFILFDSNDLLGNIARDKEHFLKDEIAQGIVFPQDFLNKKSAEILSDPRYKVGDGVFGLSDEEYKGMHLDEEKDLIRPYFTSSEIFRYITNPINHLWMIYTDSSYSDIHSLDNYPIIKKHLDQFQDIITSSSKPYGLHRARKESFFKGEKIVAQRKCVGKPIFSYSDFDCYVTQTYNIISTDRWNLKFLTGLLNSTLAKYWFKNKGKMQGENFQIDKEPLLDFPIASDSYFQTAISDIVSNIIELGIEANYTDFENQIDHLVYHLYNLTYDEVLIIDPETPITREEYENFKIE